MASSCLPSISFGIIGPLKSCLIWAWATWNQHAKDFRPTWVGLDQPGVSADTGSVGQMSFTRDKIHEQHVWPFHFYLAEAVSELSLRKSCRYCGSWRELSFHISPCKKELAEAFVLELLTECQRVNHGSKGHCVSKQRSLGLDIMRCPHRLHPASLPDRRIFGWGRWEPLNEVHASIRYGTPLVDLVQTTKMERWTQRYFSDSRTKQPSPDDPMSSPNILPNIEEVRHHSSAGMV